MRSGQLQNVKRNVAALVMLNGFAVAMLGAWHTMINTTPPRPVPTPAARPSYAPDANPSSAHSHCAHTCCQPLCLVHQGLGDGVRVS